MMRWLDKIACIGMVLGIALLLQPWLREGFRWGFFCTAFFTVLHIVTSHVQIEDSQR